MTGLFVSVFGANHSVDSVIFDGSLVVFNRINLSILLSQLVLWNPCLTMVDENKIVFKIASNFAILLTLSWQLFISLL